jgi:ABC-2 type transport system ATP-binding protein
MIRVRDLSKRFGPTLAVDQISFDVAKGEIVGFLGPNGAGKTTTIRVLCGYHPATSGSAVIAGHDVSSDSLAARRQIGYLPENVPIYPDLRVVEYLRYRAALKGVPARQRKQAVAQAMAKAGVEDVARKLCGKVSRGYRQRVGLADALVANPPILILDEPTSGLDPNQRRRIKQVVRDLANEHTILFSSHILTEVEDVSTRILVIHRGRLRADGPARDLVAHSAARRLTVAASCGVERLAGLIAGVAGLRVEQRMALPPDGARIEAVIDGDGDPMRAVGEHLLGAGVAVRELKIELPTLEEYFHSMTEGADRDEERRLHDTEGAA